MSLAPRQLVFVFLALYSSVFAETYRWDSVRIGGGGFVTGIITSKTEEGLIYARTDVGGAYRWNKDDETWIPLNDWTPRETNEFLGVESLATDPNFPNRLYMVVGWWYNDGYQSAFIRSDDYGETFEVFNVTSQFRVHGNGMGRQNGEKLQIDPNNSDILYCGSRNRGVFKSLDRGTTWARLDALDITTTSSENGISFVVIDEGSESNGSSQTLYVAVSRSGEYPYRSTDGGQTFSVISGGPSGVLPQRGVLASDGSLYLTFANGAGPHGNNSFDYDSGSVWKLDTSNDSWTNITPTGFSNAFCGVSVDPANPQRVIVSSTNIWYTQRPNSYGDRFFLSTDGGGSWTDIVDRGFDMDPNGITWIGDNSIHWAGSIEFDPFDTNVAWVVSGNGIYRCDDLSATTSVWKFAVHGFEETVPLDFVSIQDGPSVSVIGDYDGFLHADPKEYAPVHVANIGSTYGIAYAVENPDLLFRVGNVVQRSTNQGQLWTTTGSINGTEGKLALSADGTVLLHNPSNSSTTYRSTDGGDTWASVSGLSARNTHPAADPVNSDKFYAYGGTTLFRSDDAGLTFSAAATNLPQNGQPRLATVLGFEGHIWFAHSSEGLYRSVDSGASFTKLGSIDSARAIGTGKAAPDSDYPTLYVWGVVDEVEGVFRSTDQGASWLRINDDAHQFGGPGNGQFVIGDQNVFGRVYMSTAGRGIVYGEFGDSISYVDWAEDIFSESQLADEAISGEAADPDRDGLSNLLEWALQTNPLEPTNLASRMLAISGSGMELVIQQLTELSTATLTIEVSADLQTWVSLEDLFEEAGSEVSNDSLVLTKTYSPTGDNPPATLFIRVTVER